MPENPQDWELDETRTMRAILKVYKDNLAAEQMSNRESYVTREEYTHTMTSMIGCLDRCVAHMENCLRQTERLVDCMGRMSQTIYQVMEDVADLQQRLDLE